jgi:alpha-L-rhamnosidase-like protein
MSAHRVTWTGSVLALAVVATLAGLPAEASTPAGGGSTGTADDTMLGLPPLASAQRYVLAPPSRTVRPTAVREASVVNQDYVTAASRTSEVSAHHLRQGTSDVATVAGTVVRRAGVGVGGGWFSYDLRAPKGRALTLRVEEAGSADARYDVLVDGHRVLTRHVSLYAAQGRPIGVTSYTVRVPARLVDANRVRVTFRNRGVPGDGARIASVWANGGHDLHLQEYGGRATSPRGAAGNGSTGLAADFFGRPYVVYDFGREVGGTISLRASGVRGNPRLGLAFSESRTFMTTTSDFSQDPSGVATETHYFKLSDDGSVSDPVIRGGFRYLMVFLDSPGAARLSKLRLHFTADPKNPTPAAYAGAFLSSDETLNRFWYAGAYSAQMSTIGSDTGRPYPATPGPVSNDEVVAPGDVFLSDGAKRDRYDWGGDNVVSNVVSYLTTGESEPAQNSLDWFGAHPSTEGQVPGVYLPAPNGFNYGWGEYAAWWTSNYWTHFLYTGDRAFLERWFPALQGNVAWFESHVGDDGLWDVPGNAGGHWGYGQSGKEAYDNLVYVESLGAAASAAEAMGHDDLAAQWREQARRTADAVNALLWDDEAGAYVALPGSQAHPLDANALAVASGVAGPDRSARVLDFVQSHLQTPYGDRGVDTTAGNAVPDYISPFVAGLELKAFSGTGDAAGAMDVLQRTWGHMLEGDTTGTFWETVSPEGGLGLGSYTSMSHGWAAAPTNFLTNRTLGVTPTSGGFDTFDVSPQPADGLDWAEGRVPTPHGTIRTAWKRTDSGFVLTVEAPAGTTYTATVPAAADTDVRVGSTSAEPQRHAGTATYDDLSGRTTITVTPRS